MGCKAWKSLSHVLPFATPWTVAHQSPLSMDFSRQKYWSGLPFSSPGDLPNSGIKPRSPALQADSLPSEPPGKPSRRDQSSKEMHSKSFSTHTSNGSAVCQLSEWPEILSTSLSPRGKLPRMICVLGVCCSFCLGWTVRGFLPRTFYESLSIHVRDALKWLWKPLIRCAPPIHLEKETPVTVMPFIAWLRIR